MLTFVQAVKSRPLHDEFFSPIIVQSIVIDPENGSALMSTASICKVLPPKGTTPLSGTYEKSRAWKWIPSNIDMRGARVRNETEEKIQHRRTLRWCFPFFDWSAEHWTVAFTTVVEGGLLVLLSIINGAALSFRTVSGWNTRARTRLLCSSTQFFFLFKLLRVSDDKLGGYLRAGIQLG